MIKILLVVLLASLTLGVSLLFAHKRAEQKRMYQQGVATSDELIKRNRRKNWKLKLYDFLQKSYNYGIRIPLLRRYILKVRTRLAAVHSYDEMTMRRETMRITFLALGGISFSVLFLSLIGNDLTFTFFVLLGAVVVNGTLIENFVNKVADRLLYQQTELLEDVRHQYNQHGMVDEAISGASEISKYEIATHGRKIHEAITAQKPEEKLEEYYEVAPNRFLKLFAGISYLIKEYGDKNLKDKGSLYLHTLNRLKGEIFDEVLYRKKLRYYLNSLTIMALVPVFFLKPIEVWANTMFPTMGDFYSSRLGIIMKILIFIIVLLSYIFIKRIQDNEDTIYSSTTRKHKWLKAIYKKRTVALIVDKLVPAKMTKNYFEQERLLKDTNSSLTMEWFYLQRLITFVLAVVLSITLFVYMHMVSVNHTLTSTSIFKESMLLGQMSPEEEKQASEITEFDRRIIDQLKGVRENIEDQVAFLVNREMGVKASADEITQTTIRIKSKIGLINNEYFKWWELLVSFVIGTIAYHVPLWLLRFQRKMRTMQMKVEVNQMHTIIGMLSEFERVSVETLLIWMERFSTLFKPALKKCVLNFDSGPISALDELISDAPFSPFVRTIERLQNAFERVPVKEAFEDLETDRAYFQEERKQENEEILNKKANWGRFFGFAPMNAVVFLYLVLPFVYLSIISTNTMTKQIYTI
ncbi:hypothetical protein YDYSY3_39530 [Paenibacillus chitinolyticus]|uniref:hypothetical protein n=1 Tax=Paenibacillus chitinolyticus TaxID=79263 RepID=UPI0026E4AF03|nr:hypothetical protein [Paenibacillus chitinolyticus]GKS12953.1 hypothetical protein YDYSY3_39530 [Paenibacillus chitinolyticus]